MSTNSKDGSKPKSKPSAENFRVRSKIVSVLRYERSTISGSEYDDAKSLVQSKNQQKSKADYRVQGAALRTRFKKFASDRSIPEKDIPPITKLQDSLTLKGFGDKYIDFAKRYILENYNLSDALELTTDLFPLPYSRDDMGNLKKGNWYLLKRSHTVKGKYSFSRIFIDFSEHSDCEGGIYKYDLIKYADDRVNTVGGFISRNHNQYLFVGTEVYQPLDDGAKSYAGTQIIMVNRISMASVLPGIALNALNQGGSPCAAKVIMFHVTGNLKGEDKDLTGLVNKEDVEKRAIEIGIDMKQFQWPDKEEDNIQNDWGLLIAEP